MATIPTLMTAADLLRLPDDGYRRELVAGELRTMTPAGGEHGSLVMNLSTPLDVFVRAHRLGRVFAAVTGFLLASDPDTVRAPDVAFVRRERLGGPGQRGGYWAGAPDLVAEVMSPGDRAAPLHEKVADWLRHGARMAIVVDPRQRTVTVYRSTTPARVLTVVDTLDGEEVVPGWRLPVADLFATDGD